MKKGVGKGVVKKGESVVKGSKKGGVVRKVVVGGKKGKVVRREVMKKKGEVVVGGDSGDDNTVMVVQMMMVVIVGWVDWLGRWLVVVAEVRDDSGDESGDVMEGSGVVGKDVVSRGSVGRGGSSDQSIEFPCNDE